MNTAFVITYAEIKRKKVLKRTEATLLSYFSSFSFHSNKKKKETKLFH